MASKFKQRRATANQAAAAAAAAAKLRAQNRVNRPETGAGSDYDFGTNNFAGMMQWLSPMQQDQMAVNSWYTDWAARKIINIPVDDKLREEWRYDGLTEEQQNKLLAAQDALKVVQAFRRAMILERLVGGAVIYMGVTDGQTEAKEPLNLEALRPGALRFLNVIPRTRVTKTELDMDPLSANYGRPSLYYIQGQTIHRSRMIIFDGSPLLPVPDSTLTPTAFARNDGFGTSVLLPIYDEITRATGSRQAAYQLVQRAGSFIAQADLLDLEGSKQGQAAMQELQRIVNQLNAYKGAVMHRDPGQAFDPISTITPAFGSVPELVMTFLQVLSAAGDVPATRFLGQAPGGLNATGDSDLENYYGRLESEQRIELRPKLMQLLEVSGRSTLGTEFKTEAVDIIFPPLWSLSEKEQADVRTADTTNIVNLVTAGLLSDEEGIRELMERDVLLTDIDTTADPVGEVPSTTDAAAALADNLAELTTGANNDPAPREPALV
jgi:phage-related protein (TIGR01555 family)